VREPVHYIIRGDIVNKWAKDYNYPLRHDLPRAAQSRVIEQYDLLLKERL